GGLTPETPAPEASEPAVLHFQWPLSGTVETQHSTDELIYDRTMADWRTHSGMDISAPIGTLVMASSDGVVADVYDDGMYGSTVILRHSGGMTSIYSNLAATPAVSAGDTVKIGEVIGAVGDTALAEAGTVTHLHFGMTLNGEAVDPALYLPRR
ncbi:MAG: M23 family metallopeptidase, partial [Oscillospiraceae bacterium]|nr:M23 family metallopeptidase [Oscillospiraceae bacterium]